MSVRKSHRISAVVAPLIVAGFVLGACGGEGSEAESRTTVTLSEGETIYATIAPATTTTTTTIAGLEVIVGAEQEYVVQAGDYGLKVSSQFEVSLEDLESVNGWADASSEFPGPGSVIKIPAGGTNGVTSGADAAGATTADGVVVDGAAVEGETGTAIPDPGSNCEAASHTVVAGDIPLKLTELYSVSLDALNAANANNPAYQRFIPGEKIIIPAKDDC
jgi:LysM repeat protein